MTERGQKYRYDILLAIDLIESFVMDTRDFGHYSSDSKTQSAVERQLAIIGEALKRLKDSEPDLNIKNDRQIISFRNRLVHAYDSIDNSIVWVVLKKHLPKLREEMEKLYQFLKFKFKKN